MNALAETRGQLKRREAEMAAAIPVVSVEADGVHLAERLEAILRGTAEMLHCYGAGLYMLDENTTSLKLRAHHGLGDHAMLKPSRPLEDAMADVEAQPHARHRAVLARHRLRTVGQRNNPVGGHAHVCGHRGGVVRSG